MKTTLGGDRLGSGNKQELSLRNYERSTHDLSYIWRSSMSAGTLIPFINELALPGDVFDITLNADVKSLPTLGPLFGSFKLQLDVFETPIYLYNGKLHMNTLNVGMDMSDVYLPIFKAYSNNHTDYIQSFDDNEHVNPSCLLKYLGYSGPGYITGTTNPAIREINAVPLLVFWDIYKNYYANKQEEFGYYIHTDSDIRTAAMTPERALLYRKDGSLIGNCLDNAITGISAMWLEIEYPPNAAEPSPAGIDCERAAAGTDIDTQFNTQVWDNETKILKCTGWLGGTDTLLVNDQASTKLDLAEPTIGLESFSLTQIDNMREAILQYAGAGAYDIETGHAPYTCFNESAQGAAGSLVYSMQMSQEGLPVKTYQSDLLNNWIDTDWIDGTGGVNELSEIDTSSGSFTIDSLNLAQKVYKLLNRIAASGGSYDDWLNAAYSHERSKRVESPIYQGSLIKEVAFQEVISNAETDTSGSNTSPLGTLAGRASLTDKHKGGKIIVKVNEPSIIMGIVSLTPRVDVSQGNDWTINLKTYDDFHKPELDAIGFQDLLAERMHWSDTALASATSTLSVHSVGKQPAWIEYMTNVNRCYGNFADRNKEMFMTLNRRYEVNPTDGTIEDATTYIDPTKFNHIFAQSSLDSQNFWVQIAIKMYARRKMSAKIIPNL